MERRPDPGKRCHLCDALRDENDCMVGGRIKDGSRAFCPACMRTGFEDLIRNSREDYLDLEDPHYTYDPDGLGEAYA